MIKNNDMDPLTFQFHKGAIRTNRFWRTLEIWTNFNSIKVRLELKAAALLLPMSTYFNSIKVRLEQQNNTNTTQAPAFQFHKGAIRTNLCFILLLFMPEFQFHKGAIRTHLMLASAIEQLHFNSIKVRLELDARACCSSSVPFQFHKGAIRTRLQCLQGYLRPISIP